MTNINLKVLDVSHFNAVTSFQKIYDSGVRGIIHKATQGTGYVDANYKAARSRALAAGLLWGAYHFADDSDPVKQAAHFVAIADPDADTLMALDFEPNGDSVMMLAQARVFITEVERLVGRKVVLYSGNLIKETLGDKKDAFFAARRLWLAQYGPKAVVPAAWEDTGPWLWQFSDGVINRSGITVPGVSGNVDLNSFAGTDAELAASWPGDLIVPNNKSAAPIASIPPADAPVVTPTSPSLLQRVASYFTESAKT